MPFLPYMWPNRTHGQTGALSAPLLPPSCPEELLGEGIAQHFLVSDNKNVVPFPLGPYKLIYCIPVCSLLSCQYEDPTSRGGSPGCSPSTGDPASEPAPASLSPHQPILPAATRGAQASQKGRWMLCCQECGHQRSQLSAKEGSAREAVSAKLAPAQEGDPTAAVCLSGKGRLSPWGASLSPSVKTSHEKCVLASWPLCLEWHGGEAGMGSTVPGRGGIISAPHPPPEGTAQHILWLVKRWIQQQHLTKILAEPK